jgi:hypothetical protein
MMSYPVASRSVKDKLCQSHRSNDSSGSDKVSSPCQEGAKELGPILSSPVFLLTLDSPYLTLPCLSNFSPNYTINFPIDPAVALTASNYLTSRYRLNTCQFQSTRPHQWFLSFRMNNKNWNDRADKDLFFTILSVKNIGIISGSEWTTIGNHMRSLGYGFTNEGCR